LSFDLPLGQSKLNYNSKKCYILSFDAIEIYYSDNKVKRWKHYRCLGMNASTLILPNTPDVKKDFGEIKIKTQHLDNSCYTCGVFECCYDVLNQITLKSILAPTPASSYEVDLGIENFTDKTAESVRQDFWSAIFISNVENSIH
jgi:hypothetical protein